MNLDFPAPRTPPASLLAAYTLVNRVPVEMFYLNETGASSASSDQGIEYTIEEMDDCVKHAQKQLEHPAGRQHRSNGVVFADVLKALAVGGGAAVTNKNVVVFGATEPWVECLAVAAGCKSVTTVEWQQLEYAHPLMRNVGVAAFEHAVRPGGPLAASFNVAIALSAFDHDGLGRYGERLHPHGDLLAMQTAWRALKPGGRLLLSVPIGQDLVVWNLHRRYGSLRLPMLLAGWHEEGRIGWDAVAARLTLHTDHRRRVEPLFLLRRNSTADLDLSLDLGSRPMGSDAEACS